METKFLNREDGGVNLGMPKMKFESELSYIERLFGDAITTANELLESTEYSKEAEKYVIKPLRNIVDISVKAQKETRKLIKSFKNAR